MLGISVSCPTKMRSLMAGMSSAKAQSAAVMSGTAILKFTASLPFPAPSEPWHLEQVNDHTTPPLSHRALSLSHVKRVEYGRIIECGRLRHRIRTSGPQRFRARNLRFCFFLTSGARHRPEEQDDHEPRQLPIHCPHLSVQDVLPFDRFASQERGRSPSRTAPAPTTRTWGSGACAIGDPSTSRYDSATSSRASTERPSTSTKSFRSSPTSMSTRWVSATTRRRVLFVTAPVRPLSSRQDHIEVLPQREAQRRQVVAGRLLLVVPAVRHVEDGDAPVARPLCVNSIAPGTGLASLSSTQSAQVSLL